MEVGNNAMIFKYSELRRFLRYLKDNFPVTSLEAWDGSNAVILRHDVDLDIGRAHRLAIMEKECGLVSTFFVMTTSHLYNPLSRENRAMLTEVSRWGFEVGLHFDPSVYGDLDADALRRKVDEEAWVVSSIVDKSVKSVSVHNPSLHGQYALFEGYLNAYDERIFGADRYISDSRMTFSEDIYRFVERARSFPVQVLLHPMHFSEDGDGYPGIFAEYVPERVKEIDSVFRPNATYSAQIPGDLFTHVLASVSGDR